MKPLYWNGKRVLLSYVIRPFTRNPWKKYVPRHQNHWECAEIANIFTELGYKVDVINHNNRFIPRKQYSYVIDDHDNLARLSPYLNDNCVKVIHLTRFHWLELTLSEYLRLKDLRERRGFMLIPRRLPKAVPGIECADYCVIKDNDMAKASYAYAGKAIYSVHSASLNTFPWQEKNLNRCKTRFVWLGGSGAVLKGLDLVLEAFVKMPELHLTVCGPYARESDFFRAYQKELNETNNITSLGWVDTGTRQFEEILETSIGFVYPSASDTNPGAVAVCMHGGLIPIITPQCGVDVSGMGIILEECSIESIMKAARQISLMEDEDLHKMSRNAWEHANLYNTRERFAADYRTFVREVLQA